MPLFGGHYPLRANRRIGAAPPSVESGDSRLDAPAISPLMCNLYSLTKGQAAIRDWFRARHNRAGNLPLFPGIFPDQMAPIVRVGLDGGRELVMARWGMPGPPQYGGQPV